MKIVINESSESEYKGGLVFEAEIYHKNNPKITFWDNADDSVTINLHFWNSEESIDGYTTEQAEELLTILRCAVEFVKNKDVPLEDGQLELFDTGDIDGQV
jgi:hypothetical protein